MLFHIMGLVGCVHSYIPSADNVWDTVHAQKQSLYQWLNIPLHLLTTRLVILIFNIYVVYILINLSLKFLGKDSRVQTYCCKNITQNISHCISAFVLPFGLFFSCPMSVLSPYPLIIIGGTVSVTSAWLLIYHFHSSCQQTQCAVYIWNSFLHSNIT